MYAVSALGVLISIVLYWRLSLVDTIPQTAWTKLDVRSVVAFGDSYTDEGRLNYMIDHEGRWPEPGTELPVGSQTLSGGYLWARYATWYLSDIQQRSVKLYNYAISGAVCSNDLVSRHFPPLGANFPDMEHDAMEMFRVDAQHKREDGSCALDIGAKTTVYAIWLGTNDLGRGCFLTDEQTSGKTLVDYMDCIYRQIDRLYATPFSARYLVLMNVSPLHNMPVYQLPEHGGHGGGSSNATETHHRMAQQVALVNSAYQWRTMGEVSLKKRYPAMNIALFKVHDLMNDMYTDPRRFLNGSAPADVHGMVRRCSDHCILDESPDSYLWYDNLHPAEQVHRVVAREFVETVQGRSAYALYFSS